MDARGMPRRTATPRSSGSSRLSRSARSAMSARLRAWRSGAVTLRSWRTVMMTVTIPTTTTARTGPQIAQPPVAERASLCVAAVLGLEPARSRRISP